MSSMQPIYPHQLNQCQRREGCSTSKARAAERWEARPTANSITMTGRPKMTRKIRYSKMNAAPPYSPAI